MTALLVIVFLAGYILIALEHPLRINKAATALLTAIAVWVIYMIATPSLLPQTDSFREFLQMNPALEEVSSGEQIANYVENTQLIVYLGEIAEILFFLLGAMTIVELIDMHGGFDFITNRITTRRKRRLLWILALLTFFMSAILDNMTTAIVMVTLLGKLISDQRDRWLFAGVIIIAANSGGAWSPIGDVTTIMLWVRGNVTTAGLIPHLLLPSLVSLIVPLLIVQRSLRGEASPVAENLLSASVHDGKVIYRSGVSRRERLSILILGVLCLLFVPVFKTLTHLPPVMGILGALGVMWLYTELMYRRKNQIPENQQLRIPNVLRRVDTPTILFFLGILLAVYGLQASGVLNDLSMWLDREIHNVYAINLFVGVLSSVVDNVPLVAGAIATYPVADPAMIATAADATYLQHFVQNGAFWEFLAYCAGVGGSILIIGSAAGVIVMGLEKISFGWYIRNITLAALAGYLAGAAVYILDTWLIYGAL